MKLPCIQFGQKKAGGQLLGNLPCLRGRGSGAFFTLSFFLRFIGLFAFTFLAIGTTVRHTTAYRKMTGKDLRPGGSPGLLRAGVEAFLDSSCSSFFEDSSDLPRAD